jgi:hypothetical protein
MVIVRRVENIIIQWDRKLLAKKLKNKIKWGQYEAEALGKKYI